MSAAWSEAEAETIAAVIRRASGLSLAGARGQSLELRLAPRLRVFDGGARAYAEALASDEAERSRAIDLLATVHTAWWREAHHFEDLESRLLPSLRPRLASGSAVRVWCAGCASGEEAYSIALCLRRTLGDDADAAVLATDISAAAIELARRGRYADEQLAPLNSTGRALAVERSSDVPGEWTVQPELRRLVHIARHNLVGPWPMRGPFDAIFCRNVLIHLVPEVRLAIVERFASLLAPHGTLYVGAVELLDASVSALRRSRPMIHVV